MDAMDRFVTEKISIDIAVASETNSPSDHES